MKTSELAAEKRKLERDIFHAVSELTQDFTQRSGVHIPKVDLCIIETTTFSSESAEYALSNVSVDISV